MEHWTERLSEYLDGELSPPERAACEAHLGHCESCRNVLGELQLVTTIAQADPDKAPGNDLWPGILARIESRSARVANFADHTARRAPRTISFTLPQLALAASLLVAVTAGVAFVATGRVAVRPESTAAAEAPIQAVAEPTLPPSPDILPANFDDAQFDRAVIDLEQVLVEQRDELDPATVMVIERNLKAIDEAIQQARAALEADPANPFLNSHLAQSRRRKLDLLRHATTLNSVGD